MCRHDLGNWAATSNLAPLWAWLRASSTVAGRTLNVLVKAAFANALSDDLLSDAITIDRAKAFFSRYVDQVEIENHSFCNRVCWFCPNAFIDRRSVSHEMP